MKITNDKFNNLRLINLYVGGILKAVLIIGDLGRSDGWKGITFATGSFGFSIPLVRA